jgi:hypothetical protein
VQPNQALHSRQPTVHQHHAPAGRCSATGQTAPLATQQISVAMVAIAVPMEPVFSPQALCPAPGHHTHTPAELPAFTARTSTGGWTARTSTRPARTLEQRKIEIRFAIQCDHGVYSLGCSSGLYAGGSECAEKDYGQRCVVILQGTTTTYSAVHRRPHQSRVADQPIELQVSGIHTSHGPFRGVA